MAAAYKVQNMQQIVDNITPKAVSEEAEEMVDHHSVVAVVDLSVEVEEVVLMVAIIKILANHSKTMVHHKWLDVHLSVDHHEVLVVLWFEVVDDHHSEAAMDMMAISQVEVHVSFAVVEVQWWADQWVQCQVQWVHQWAASVVVVDFVVVAVAVDDFSEELAKEIVMIPTTIIMTIKTAVKMEVNHQSKQPFNKT
jgi:hypothetical protein